MEKVKSFCVVCKQVKSASEFYKDKKARANGGLQYQCKECVKEIRRRYYDSHREQVTRRVVTYKRAHPEQYRRYHDKERAEQTTEEKQAWGRLNRELLAGRINRPATCQRCGESKKLSAHHHNGYSSDHALDVIWLCVPCHHAAHGRGPVTRNQVKP